MSEETPGGSDRPTPPTGPAADRDGRSGPPTGPRGDGGPPSGPRGGGDRPGFGDRPGGGGGGRFGDRPGGGGGGRFGGRGGRDDRPRAPQTVKGRLRAKARKKARRLQKQAARTGKVFARKKVSRLTTDSQLEIDYRDPKTLRYFLTETGKIVPRRISGNTAKQQREVCLAIKRARHLALVAFPGQVD